jgi:hypothetical protein
MGGVLSNASEPIPREFWSVWNFCGPQPIGIGELEPLPTQLPSKDAILFHQIREGLPPWRSTQPVRTASTIWTADASITAGV